MNQPLAIKIDKIKPFLYLAQLMRKNGSGNAFTAPDWVVLEQRHCNSREDAEAWLKQVRSEYE